MKTIQCYLGHYWWLVAGCVVVLGAIWLGWCAWYDIQQPILVDIFWSESLQMYEPVYIEPLQGLPSVWRIVCQVMLVVPTIIAIYWHSPLWFIIPYSIALATLILKLIIMVGVDYD